MFGRRVQTSGTSFFFRSSVNSLHSILQGYSSPISLESQRWHNLSCLGIFCHLPDSIGRRWLPHRKRQSKIQLLVFNFLIIFIRPILKSAYRNIVLPIFQFTTSVLLFYFSPFLYQFIVLFFFFLLQNSENPGLLCNWRNVVTVESIFKTLKLLHEGARSHTGYHKQYKDVGTMHSGISRKLCAEFVKGCMYCTCKKPQQNIAPLKPIVSKHFMHRGQLDLVDKRADPDGQYKWIGHYIDRYTKFNLLCPQEQKSAHEVAENLKKHVFSVIGLPTILQHDHGREFCNNVIRETLNLWQTGNVQIITGIPRHPRTQGLVEQVHCSLHRLLASNRAEKPGSGWL